ncbi:MAG TPA: histidine triad nucleotide-binding protein [candidate division Zixibacteria bacterium]|jgi:histidine triad (HIT) family protein
MTDERPYNEHCIFCRIIAKEMPAKIRYESEHVVAFEDINPHAPTHVLICPTGHYPTFLESPPDVLAQLDAAVKGIAEELGFGERGFRLVVNNGPESGQIVFHLHYHFLAGKKMGGF